MLTVVCFFWSTPDYQHAKHYQYSADYVNRLRNMLERHLHIPHELVCVTDQPEGIDERVRIIPFPAEVRDWPGYLRRLIIWRPDAAELFGGERLLLIDIDVVILRDITPLVDRSEDLVMWEPRLYYALNGNYSRYNCGFMLMNAGCRPQVWTEFSVERAQRELATVNDGSVDDQAWPSYILGESEAVWPWDGDIVSVKAVPAPHAARMVFFNGPRAPGMPDMQKQFPWITDHWR